MYRGHLKNTSNLVFHRPQSACSREEQELMQKSSRALSSTTDPLEKLRLLCFSRGAAGIMGLGRVLRHMDEDGSKQLSKREFVNGIKETGLEIDDQDAEQLFAKFDLDKSGSISLDEFMRQLRPPMSDSRRAIVEQAFRKLDKTGDGIISVQDIKDVYSVKQNSLYLSGEDSKNMILTEFLANFETEGTVDGNVTMEEFMNYYSGLSVAIEDDGYFDLMMRRTYKL